MFEEFLHAPDSDLYLKDNYTPQQAGYHLFSPLITLANITDMKVVLLGVKDDRGSKHNSGSALAPDIIRRHLFSLARIPGDLHIADLGNIEAGETIRDTYVALSKVVNELLRMKITPVIIGGSHDLTFAQFGAYHDLGRNINISIVDSRVDFEPEQEHVHDENFLMNILSYEPSIFFNCNLIGYQSHLTSPSAVDFLERLQFESYRLGKTQTDFSDIEPVLRGSNLVSFDMSVIRYADSPGHSCTSPNGLYAEEFCQLARYAGMSDSVDSFGIYGCNPTVDVREMSCQLAAQTLWYFLDGASNRKNDFPVESDKDYTKYTIHFKDSQYEMNFWKSAKSDRWWMEVPTGNAPRNKKKFQLIPCSYNDYQTACREELPERWLKTYQKLS